MVNIPQIKETTISVAYGGKFQLKKYEVSADFHVGVDETYTLPAEYSDLEIMKFREEKFRQIKEFVDERAEEEIDKLLKEKDKI